jgi:hypothetical protein
MIMKTMYASLAFLLLFSASKLAAQSYKSPRLEEAKFNHKTMAVLPYYVTEKDKTARTKKESGNKEGVTSTDETEGFNLQRALYNYFITRKPKNVNWTVTFQPYEETNQKLKAAGIVWEEIPNTPKDKLGEILGVDAYIYAEVKKTTTLDQGSKVAVQIFTGTNVPTGNVDVETSIYETESGELMWKLDNQVPTDYYYNIGADKLTDNLMKKAVNQFPYKEKVKK